jgi:hypothetical protein
MDLPSPLRHLALDELRLQALIIELPLPPPPTADAAGAAAWDLAPVAGLGGELRIEVTDAAWLFDADVRVPIEAGSIDFDRATVSHIGPDSSMGLSRLGLYVDAPNGRQYLAMLAAPALDGLRFERRGALTLAPLLQALLGGIRPLVPAAGAQALLQRTRVGGTLRLADGPMGDRGRAGPALSLTGAAAGHNQVELASPTGGGGLLLRWPRLSAEGLRWPLPGPTGDAGCVSADALSGSLSIEVAAAPGGRMRAVLRAPELLLRRLRLPAVSTGRPAQPQARG